MVRSKAALISSALILMICMCLFFPFPNNELFNASSTFMSFPITNKDGFIMLGLIGAVLYITAIILLIVGLKKYHFRTILLVIIVYAIFPKLLITIYQETLASGIYAISYDENGYCNFESLDQGFMNGDCHFIIHNRSNTPVSFELEFVDVTIWNDDVRMESLMNVNGPYHMMVEANRKKSIELNEILDVYDIPNRIEGGSTSGIHFQLIDGENARVL